MAERVQGIGEVFFKAEDPEKLCQWYEPRTTDPSPGPSGHPLPKGEGVNLALTLPSPLGRGWPEGPGEGSFPEASLSAQAPQMPVPGPMGPGGKITGTDHNEMLPGGFFLVLHSNDDSPMGQIHELAIMGYDSGKKAYTYNAYNNFGEAEVYTGAVEGDTWTWTSPTMINGKMMNSRFTAKEASPSSYTFKFDVSSDGSTWTNIMEGTATKMK